MSDKEAGSNVDTVAVLEVIVLEATFPVGHLVATARALGAIQSAGQTIADFLGRHVRRDWGNLDAEDEMANSRALEIGERVLSAYTMADGTDLWIITESDRSATTLLLPDEY